jgi:hypothetical protein
MMKVVKRQKAGVVQDNPYCLENYTALGKAFGVRAMELSHSRAAYYTSFGSGVSRAEGVSLYLTFSTWRVQRYKDLELYVVKAVSVF